MGTGKKKYFLIGGMVILLMIISGYGFVAAWGPCRGFDKGLKHDFHGRGFHSGFHDRDLAEFFLRRLDKRVKELGLSEAQQEKYMELRSIIETHMKEGMADRKKMLEELHREILNENPDVMLMTESLKKKLKEMTGFIEETLDLFAEFYETLDNSQRDKILEPIRERVRYHNS